MYVFIAIIFIAELIIAGAAISWLIGFDKKAKAVTEQWVSTGRDSVELVRKSREILISAQEIMEKGVVFLKRKKREIHRKILHLALIYLILVVFKTKFKKAAVILEYAILLKDFWKSIPI